MPGLIDAHGHIESLGASLEQVDLRGVNSLEEVGRRVKARLDRGAGGRVDHRRPVGPEPLARGRLSDRGRARCRRARSSCLAYPGRRPRRLGQLRGVAPGGRDQGHQGSFRRPDPPRRRRPAHGRLHRRGDEPGGAGHSGRSARGPEAAHPGGAGTDPRRGPDRRARRRDLPGRGQGLSRARPVRPAAASRLWHGAAAEGARGRVRQPSARTRAHRLAFRAAERSSSSSTAPWAREGHCSSSLTTTIRRTRDCC